MKKISEGSGIPFQLRSFRSVVKGIKEFDASSVVFAGSKYVCLPFAELHGYAIRDIKRQYFIPEVDVGSGVRLVRTSIGFQCAELDDKDELYHPDVLTLLGGLALPDSGVSHEDVNELIRELKPKYVLGLSFMGVFEKAGWHEKVDFDSVIDGQMSSVVFLRE